MVFTSIHPSLKPLLFSTQGPNHLNPWLNPLHQFRLLVHPSSFSHLSRIWVFILILECPSIGKFQRHARHLSFTFVHCRHIRSSLTTEACKTIAAAIVGSRLDYCNSLLAGTSVSNLTRLQPVQTEKSRFCHITPVLSDLHWLPVRHRINFKIATITFKVLQFQQSSYLAALIPRYVPTQSLRSSSSLSLCVPNRKLQWQSSNHFHLLPQIFGINFQVILNSSISTLPAFI